MKARRLLAGIIGLSFVVAAQAPAAYTYTKHNVDELNPDDVLNTLYGGSFKQVGVDYSNGQMSARRVDDDADQVWTGEFVAQIVGRFSNSSQSIGRTENHKFQHLMTANDLGFDSSNYKIEVVLDNEPLLRSGDSGTHSSRNSDNADGRDHLITYEIVGTAEPTWLLFWEDLSYGPTITRGRSTSDFNDLVVMLRAGDLSGEVPSPVPVPLPPALAVGLIGFCMAAFAVWRRVA